jgi:hypothetical protein
LGTRDTFTVDQLPQLAHDLTTVDISFAETVMAELSPHNVVINDQSVDESKSAGVNASHQDNESAVTGHQPHSTQHQLPPPHDSDIASVDQNSSQDHAHLNGTINREIDNATPDQGSDTDSSRPDASKVARSSSVKKPLSFKPVSITKSFLAKTATTPGNTPPPVKVAEKRAPTDFKSYKFMLTP